MSDNDPTQRGKIIPYKGRGGVANPPNDSEGDTDTDEDMDHEHNRLRDVEKSVQDTRERMLEGFGDIKASIERTNTNMERARADTIERVSTSEKELGKQINETKDALNDKISSVERTSNKRSWTVMGILLGGMSIATVVLIYVLNKSG